MSNFDQIEDYLRDRLDSAERADFNTELAENPAFRADFELFREAHRQLEGRRIRRLVGVALVGLPVQETSFFKKHFGKIIGTGLVLAAAVFLFFNKNRLLPAPRLAADWVEMDSTLAPTFMNCAAAYEGKVYFSGGSLDRRIFIGPYNDKLEIVDLATGTIRRASGGLSVARCYLSAAAFNGKVYFAGGHIWSASAKDSGFLKTFDIVDIYDIASDSWTVAHLSEPRTAGAVAVVGGKILFAGGVTFKNGANLGSDVVDILDPATGRWEVQHLSRGRADFSAAVVGKKAFFCGGMYDWDKPSSSSRVDIFDAVTGKWTVNSLSQARSGVAVVGVGKYLLCAGGQLDTIGKSNRVDILDTESGKWRTDTLSLARCGIAAAAVGGRAYFTGGGYFDIPTFFLKTSSDVVDILDAENQSWSVGKMNKNRTTHACAAWGNKIAVLSGWRAEQMATTGSVEILADLNLGPGVKLPNPGPSFSISPDPVSDILTISFLEKNAAPGRSALVVTDFSGKEFLRKTLTVNVLNENVDVSGLKPGLYYLHLETGGKKGKPQSFEVAR